MPGAEIPPLAAAAKFCVVSRRNESLGSRRCWWLFVSLWFVSFGLGLGFAAPGAWMVLPYSALEMAVLYLALRWIERHAAERERVSVCGDRVIVERERAGVRLRQECNRYWARVETEQGVFDHPPRLKLWFTGQGMAFGDEQPKVARTIVARDLRRALAAR